MDPVNADGVGLDFEEENFCHNGHWNGFYDWRPATFADIDASLKRASLGGRNGYSYLRLTTGSSAYIYSSKTYSANTGMTYMFNTGPAGANNGKWYNQTSGVVSPYTKGNGYHGICVRDPNPTSTYTPLDQ